MKWIVLKENGKIRTDIDWNEAKVKTPKGYKMISVKESVNLMRSDKKFKELMTKYWTWCSDQSVKSPKELFEKEKWAKNVWLSSYKNGELLSFWSCWYGVDARPDVDATSPLGRCGRGVAVYVRIFKKNSVKEPFRKGFIETKRNELDELKGNFSCEENFHEKNLNKVKSVCDICFRIKRSPYICLDCINTAKQKQFKLGQHEQNKKHEISKLTCCCDICIDKIRSEETQRIKTLINKRFKELEELGGTLLKGRDIKLVMLNPKEKDHEIICEINAQMNELEVIERLIRARWKI